MKKIIFSIVVISFLGCFDIFREKEENIVGNISVINPDNQEDKGYRMVFYENNFNSNLFDGYVENVIGNDSILIVKSIDKTNCDDSYYSIKHYKGKKILSVIKIGANDYLNLKDSIKSTYNFHDESAICP